MSLKNRLLLLGVAAALEAALFVGFGLYVPPIPGAVWVAVGLVVALTTTSLIIEPFFSKPSDTFSTCLITLAVWLPLGSSITDNRWLFIAFSCALSLLAVASVLTMVLNSPASEAESSNAQRFSQALHALISRATPSRAITTAGLVCFPLVAGSSDNLSAFCLVSAALLNLVRPDVMGRVTKALWKPQISNKVGVLEAFRSDGRYLVGAFREAPPILSPCVAVTSGGSAIVGLVTRTLRANDREFFEMAELSGAAVPPYPEGCAPRRNEVARPPADTEIDCDDVVGIVAPATTISQLRFQTFPTITTLSAGDLVHTEVSGRSVIYQITEAALVEERVSTLDRDTEIFVSGRQIGFWSDEHGRFDAHGWLPGINAFIRSNPLLPENPVRPEEINVGILPGTNFNINVNFDDLITHHCAVLGVTGTGKSVFVRDFIRKLTGKAVRCICVDLTGEYAKRFGQECKPLVSEETDKAIARCINWLVAEEAKFANQRDNAKIAECKEKIRGLFASSIKSFIESDKNISVLGMADLDGSSENIEYLRWFSITLFDMAKKAELGLGRIALVLEEAHTIVPETAFLTAQDGRTKGLVNSISQIALQGRKYGVGLVVVAQRTANVSKTILTQCNTIIAFRQFDRTSFEFLGSLLGEDSAKVLPTLRARHAYISGKATGSSSPLIFRVPDIEE